MSLDARTRSGLGTGIVATGVASTGSQPRNRMAWAYAARLSKGKSANALQFASLRDC